MDFHTLTRRQLQTLCKKNKIPANITNVAMAEALFALPTVEGIEELSPGKSLADGGASICRTTTTTRRARSVKDESDENVQPTTARTTRRSTRKDVGHQKRQTPSKIETLDFTGIDEEEESAETGGSGKQKGNVTLNTPAPVVVPAGRQRGLNLKGGETTVTRMSTRRSTRLAVKNEQRSDDTYSVPKKMDFEEIPKGADCSAHHHVVDSVAESLELIDLNGKPEEGLEKSNDAAAGPLLVGESDCPAKKPSHSEVGLDVDDGSHGSELVEPKMVVNNDSDDVDDATKEKTFEIGEELDTNIHVLAEDKEDVVDDAFSVEIGTELNMFKGEVVVVSDIDEDISLADTKNGSVVEDGTEKVEDEKEVQSSDFAAESVDEEKKNSNSEEMDHSRIEDFEVEESGDSEISPKTEERDVVGIITEPTVVEPVVELERGISSAPEEALEGNLAEKFNAMELDSGVNPSSEKEELMKDSTGNNAVINPVSDCVTLEQSSGGYGVVLEMKNKQPEEEDLNNTSMELNVEGYSTKPQEEAIAAAASDSNENQSVELNFEKCSSEQEEDAIDAVETSDCNGNQSMKLITEEYSSEPEEDDAIEYLSLKASVSPLLQKSVSKTPTRMTMNNVSDDKENDMIKLSPLLQMSVSKTPTSGKRMALSKVTDDKENNMIENNVKKLVMVVAKENNEKEEMKLVQKSLKPRDEDSLRTLKKKVKALEAVNNKKAAAAASTRPALQALPENQQVS